MVKKLADIFPVTAHTDFVGPGSTFVAIRGLKGDGIAYVECAIEKGAKTIVLDKSACLAQADQAYSERGVTLVRVDNTRCALAHLSAQAAGHPARALKIIGITGTQGKTTCVFLLESVLKKAGYKTALLSGVKNAIAGEDFSTELTTQQPDYIHQFLRLAVERSVEYVVMEVAAQALTLYRVAGIEFDAVIFTNFSQEHGEFYPSVEEYFQAKCLIAKQLKPNGIFLINGDDERLTEYAVQFVCQPLRFAVHAPDAFYKALVHTTDRQLHFVPIIDGKTAVGIQTQQALGIFSVYNYLAVFALAHQLGISEHVAAWALSTFEGVPGRIERYTLTSGALCIIDYPHTLPAWHSILSVLRNMTEHLIVVFGAGGGRGDAHKRAMMGKLVSEYADVALVTSDNPRHENPDQIMFDIQAGMLAKAHVIAECDRKKAIEIACSIAHKNSIVALLGKGHEEYQQIGSTKYYFSEREIIKAYTKSE